MIYRNIFVTAAIVTASALWAVPLCAQDKMSDEYEKSSVWMKLELEATRNILHGLTESDFDEVRANAEAMSFLGFLEKWTRADMKGYQQQVSYFDFADRELVRQARDKNLDARIQPTDR